MCFTSLSRLLWKPGHDRGHLQRPVCSGLLLSLWLDKRNVDCVRQRTLLRRWLQRACPLYAILLYCCVIDRKLTQFLRRRPCGRVRSHFNARHVRVQWPVFGGVFQTSLSVSSFLVVQILVQCRLSLRNSERVSAGNIRSDGRSNLGCLHRPLPSTVNSSVFCFMFHTGWLLWRRGRNVSSFCTTQRLNSVRCRSSTCSGQCNAGHFCNAGSSSPTQNNCGLGQYCPAGSPVHLFFCLRDGCASRLDFARDLSRRRVRGHRQSRHRGLLGSLPSWHCVSSRQHKHQHAMPRRLVLPGWYSACVVSCGPFWLRSWPGLFGYWLFGQLQFRLLLPLWFDKRTSSFLPKRFLLPCRLG